ncbi:hypothetical protein ACTJI2_13600 [Pseudoxanthomonas sp. 22568]|uniref:hypothetical protein n=1 Tax=Pseudoxanthomonas sp. 22568 TaxID=3453945 RepID=UPI003F87765E
MATTQADRSRLEGRVWARLHEAELSMREVTVMHRDIFHRAGIEWRDGQSMEELISSVSDDQLRRLVAELPNDDEEED